MLSYNKRSQELFQVCRIHLSRWGLRRQSSGHNGARSSQRINQWRQVHPSHPLYSRTELPNQKPRGFWSQGVKVCLCRETRGLEVATKSRWASTDSWNPIQEILQVSRKWVVNLCCTQQKHSHSITVKKWNLKYNHYPKWVKGLQTVGVFSKVSHSAKQWQEWSVTVSVGVRNIQKTVRMQKSPLLSQRAGLERYGFSDYKELSPGLTNP